ncbi:Glycoside hydrolase [Flavobacterium sp. 9AF]|uniref:C40 family peptidase n=1 Tax=Flavobacterium sp. 9AF TaxID=2653142 RepID=UPI0012EF5065|nr:C40 family peptidase [Flavobacterium sp. 9AF]VXB70904.1 Glycoside hydrolase [Flavobacterium sp. 9AF]
MKLNFLVILTFVLFSFQCLENNKKEGVKESKPNKKILTIEELEELKILLPREERNGKEISQEINREALVDFAKTFIDVPYVYSCQDPKKGFDCSGFVNYVYKNFNIQVPRSSSGFKNFGKHIAIDSIALGDVLVFTGYKDTTTIGHVGIVCEANGLQSKFIHASSGKAMKVVISELNSDHYSKRFYKAIDVINK